jgi:hypothetical protein
MSRLANGEALLQDSGSAPEDDAQAFPEAALLCD